ncbi:MAG: dienelactone hydrolase family protein [Microthrixaceae bacterium]|nr:dienelactone hydrolase family protein [Microthrixaceae bacterium]
MHTELASGTPAYVVEQSGAKRAVVVIPDIWGLRELFSEMCEDLSATTGWSVGAFDPFGGADLPPADHPEGFERRVEALKVLDDGSLLGGAVATAGAMGCDTAGLIGFCMGGMYALKASATGRFDRIGAFYGMITVPDEWSGPGQRQPLEALLRRGDAQVMAVVGTADAWTPPDAVSRLEAVGVQVIRYEGAEHGFVHDPDRPTHRPDDAADAWRRVIAFIGGASVAD